MPVRLHHANDLASAGAVGAERCVAIAGATLPSNLVQLAGTARRLERAFDEVRDDYWTRARQLQEEPTATLAHAVCCNPSPSDFAGMLAWTRLVSALAAEAPVTLVLCDDPWLFRELATIDGVAAGRPPSLLPARVRGWARGWIARTGVALRMAMAAWRTRDQRDTIATHGQPALLTYGHGASIANGDDAYFGRLMADMPDLVRALHVDTDVDIARVLTTDGRSAELHAWGSPWFALTRLPMARWRPRRQDKMGRYGWLVRRAAAHEGATGLPAMTAWQIHCQDRWLAATRPCAVVWPWENQPWERPLVRTARARRTTTLGYQHTIVGRHMWNQSPHANADGLASVPDRILCNGPAYAADLERQGFASDRLVIAGAFRFKPVAPLSHDPAGAVFVALPGNIRIATDMLAVIVRVAARHQDTEFLIKAHPMYPMAIAPTAKLRSTHAGLYDQPPLRAVIYTMSAVGLEAYLAGLPTIRFVPSTEPVVEVLPRCVDVPGVDEHGLDAALAVTTGDQGLPAPPAWGDIFSAVDLTVWRRELSSDANTRELEMTK